MGCMRSEISEKENDGADKITCEDQQASTTATCFRWFETLFFLEWLIELGAISQAWNCTVLNGCAIFLKATPTVAASILKTKPHVFVFRNFFLFVTEEEIRKLQNQSKKRMLKLWSRKMISGYQFIVKARSKRKLTQTFLGINLAFSPTQKTIRSGIVIL